MVGEMNTQPEALRLADDLEYAAGDYIADVHQQLVYNSAAELRRLHSVNAELLGALKALRAEFITTVDGEWGDGVGEKWMPEYVDAAIARAEGEQK